MRLRFSIRGLMALVSFVGIGFAALRYATDWWASGVFTATLIGLALSAAYAVHRRGPRRAFWSAFATFGAGYMIMAFGPWCETAIRPRLLTTKMIDLAYPRFTEVGSPISFSFSPDVHIIPPVGRDDPTVRIWGPHASRQDRFASIGHSLAALLIAGIGGTASRYFHANRDERRREAAEKAAGVILRVLEAGL
jgi:hypothetical protein